MSTAVRRQVLVSYAILLGILTVLLVTAVWPPIAARAELLAAIESSRDIYGRARKAIAEAEAFAGNTSDIVDPAALLHGETDALAAAELQQSIASIIGHEGAELISTAYQRETDELPLLPVRVPVRLRSSVQALPAILQTLQSTEPRLHIANLNIQSRHRPGRAIRDLNDELDVQLEVIGYLLPGVESP